MKVDPKRVFERYIATENPGLRYTPVNQNNERAIGKRVIDALCAELNDTIERALYSIDSSALERLGTLIAEHALGRKEIVWCVLPPGHEGPCASGAISPDAPRCRLSSSELPPVSTPFTNGTLVYRDLHGRESRFTVTSDSDGRAQMQLESITSGSPIVRRDEPQYTPAYAERLASREYERAILGVASRGPMTRTSIRLTSQVQRVVLFSFFDDNGARPRHHASSLRLSAYIYGRGWASMNEEISRNADGIYEVRLPAVISAELGGRDGVPILLRADMNGARSTLLEITLVP